VDIDDVEVAAASPDEKILLNRTSLGAAAGAGPGEGRVVVLKFSRQH